MGVKDLIKKMEELAADGKVESSNNAAPSHKAAAPVTRPAVASPAEQPAAEPKKEPVTPAAASNGSAKENGAQLPADSGSGKEPEDPEKKAKKV